MNITVKEHGADCPFNMNGEYMCCNLTDASSPEAGLECDRADPWPDWCPIKQGPVTVSTDPPRGPQARARHHGKPPGRALAAR